MKPRELTVCNSFDQTLKTLLDSNLCFIADHVSRLNVLAGVYEQESNAFKNTIAADYKKATMCHQQEKRSLLTTVSALQSHYRESYAAQKSHFQIRKDDIINQVRDSYYRNVGYKERLCHQLNVYRD